MLEFKPVLSNVVSRCSSFIPNLESDLDFSGRHSIVSADDAEVRNVSSMNSKCKHECKACHMEFPLPRAVVWPQKFTIDKKLLEIKPTTPETIVVFQTWDKAGKPSIHPEVFKNFSYTQPHTKDLVRGIHYSKGEGFINSKRGSSDSIEEATKFLPVGGDASTAYLRLITLNTWYWALSANLAATSLNMMEFQSNVMLCALLVSDEELITILGNLRLVFIFGWLALLFIAIFFAYREAKWEWSMKANQAKGDLISDCSAKSKMRTFVAMIAFEFFGIEQDVKDLPILLHPWKGVQEYGAFKCEGHRAFFVGYASKTMHRVESSRAVWCSLPPQVLTKTILFLFKAYLTWHTMNLPLGVATLCTLLSIGYGYMKLFIIFRQRRLFRRRLLRGLESGRPGSAQYNADQRLLAKHFRRAWDPLTKQVKSGGKQSGDVWKQLSTDGNQVCGSCGRNKEGMPGSRPCSALETILGTSEDLHPTVGASQESAVHPTVEICVSESTYNLRAPSPDEGLYPSEKSHQNFPSSVPTEASSASSSRSHLFSRSQLIPPTTNQGASPRDTPPDNAGIDEGREAVDENEALREGDFDSNLERRRRAGLDRFEKVDSPEASPGRDEAG